MSSSLLPESELRAEFGRRRLRQWLVVIPVVISIVIIRFASDSGDPMFYGVPTNVAIGAAFVLLIGAIVFSLINWRCPSCSKYLGKGINPSYCQKCGFKLKA
jgi:hypothetical protein